MNVEDQKRFENLKVYLGYEDGKWLDSLFKVEMAENERLRNLLEAEVIENKRLRKSLNNRTEQLKEKYESNM